jgi:hypothetical protein
MIEGINVRWPDASVCGIHCDYDAFSVEIQEAGQRKSAAKLVRCLGFLGFQLIGFWDEIIIHAARIHSNHDFITQCEQSVVNQLPSGSAERAVTGNHLLEIELIDGCRLWVCARRFVLDGTGASDPSLGGAR